MTRGPFPVLTWEAFSPEDVTDVVEGFDAPVAADPASDLGGCRLVDGEAGDGVDGDGLPLLGASLTDPAGDADCLGGVREQQSLCQSDDLDGPALVASMATVILGVHDGDLPPRKVLDLGVQARLVLLHNQDVMRVLFGHEERCMLALGMRRVRRHHRTGEIQSFQQRPEPRDLIRLACHPGLAEHDPGDLVQHRQQMQRLAVGGVMAGAPQSLAVHGKCSPFASPAIARRVVCVAGLQRGCRP
jgi:hypothetical protein